MNNEQNESIALSSALQETTLNMQNTVTAVQLDPSLVRAYCWSHDPGGWNCQACRKANER